MSNFAWLGLGVDSRPIATATERLDRLPGAARRAERATGDLTRTTGGLGLAMRRAAGGVAAAVGAYAAAATALSTSQDYARIANSLKSMGASATEAAGTIAKLGDIANRTRTPLTATAQLYRRVAVAAGDLGASQDEVLAFSENVGLALGASGTSAQEASGALLQLSQAMAGGTVRAEEFNSILEGAFPIAQAAADGIEGAAGSVGKLRSMVIAGEVSSKEFFDAILSQSSELEASFARTEATVGQAFTVLRNNVTTLVGTFDAATGATSGFSNAIIGIANNLDILLGVAISTAAFFAGRFAISMAVTAASSIMSAVTSTIALERALGATTTSAAIASGAVKGLSVALGFLRAAIISTGIGALVVGAGYLLAKFAELVTATGGWGNALGLLGDVASGVWEGIKTSAESIKPALSAVWKDVQAGFLRVLENMTLKWANFLSSMAGGLGGFGEFTGVATQLTEASGNAYTSMAELNASIVRLESDAGKARDAARSMAVEGFGAAREAASKLSDAVAGAGGDIEDGATTVDKLNASIEDLADPSSGKGSAKAAENAVLSLGDAISGPLSTGIDGVSRAFGDWLTDSLSNFADFRDAIVGSFKQMLSQMIAYAARNQIMVTLGLGGMGVAGMGVAGGMGGGMGGAPVGLLGNLLGSGGTGALGALGSGLGGVLSGGGIGSSFANLGGLLTGASSGLGAIGAALPAIGAAVAAVAFAVDSLQYKTQNTAIRGTFTDDGFEGESYVHQKRRLFNKSRTSTSDVPAELQEAIDATFGAISSSVADAAASLDLQIDTSGFRSAAIDITTMGRSTEEILGDMMAAATSAGDQMVDASVSLDGLARAGEGSLETLTRLSGAMDAVNDAADILGHRIWDVSLASADAASSMVDAFGGLESMSQAVGVFWGAFYSEAERAETATRRLEDAFADLGLVMPQSRIAFRELVEGVDTTSEAGRKLYADLILLAGALDEVLPSVTMFTQAVSGLMAGIDSDIADQIEASRDAANASREAARDWYRTADTIRDLLRDLTGSSLGTGTDNLSAVRDLFQATQANALGGSIEAASDLPAIAQRLLQIERDSASSDFAFRLASSQIQSDLKLAAGVADFEGANQDYIGALYDLQQELLGQLSLLMQVEGLTAEELEALGVDLSDLGGTFESALGEFESALGSLQGAIEEAGSMTYAQLKERLEVTVELLPEADIPEYLKELIASAQDGVSTYIDFILRSDLDAPDKWLALTNASEFIKTISFVMDGTLPPELAGLAITTQSELLKSVRFIVTENLPPDILTIALAGTSELAKVVTLSLDAFGSDPDALLLALDNVGEYAVTIQAALAPGIDERLRDFVLSESGVYAAVIRSTFDLGPLGARVLLTQAGDYVAEIRSWLNLGPLGSRVIEAQGGDYVAEIRGQIASNVAPWVRAVLETMSGAAGTITIGGGMLLDPGEAFKTWYGNATRDLVTAPMGALRDRIKDLRAAIIADTEAREDARESEKQVASLQAALFSKVGDKSELVNGAQSIIDSIRALEARTGVQLMSGNQAATLGVNEFGQISYNADSVAYTPGVSDLTGFNAMFRGEGGLEDQLTSLYGQGGVLKFQIENLREQIIALGGIPAFAQGGFHSGGMRLVGERGPELEIVGPSRVFSAERTRQMMTGGGELRQLCKSIDFMRQELLQTQLQIIKHTQKLANLHRKWDNIGLPVEQEPI